MDDQLLDLALEGDRVSVSREKINRDFDSRPQIYLRLSTSNLG